MIQKRAYAIHSICPTGANGAPSRTYGLGQFQNEYRSKLNDQDFGFCRTLARVIETEVLKTSCREGNLCATTRRYVLAGFLVAPLMFAQGAQPEAATVLMDGSGATGILGLSVGSESYGIEFVSGTYNSVFPGMEVFSNASAIVDAIVIEINGAGGPAIAAMFSLVPAGTFLVPTVGSPNPLEVFVVSSECNLALTVCTIPWETLAWTFVEDKDMAFTWAVPALQAVPLPAALPLLGSALAM